MKAVEICVPRESKVIPLYVNGPDLPKKIILRWGGNTYRKERGGEKTQQEGTEDHRESYYWWPKWGGIVSLKKGQVM